MATEAELKSALQMLINAVGECFATNDFTRLETLRDPDDGRHFHIAGDTSRWW
jgi:hypothetical protein